MSTSLMYTLTILYSLLFYMMKNVRENKNSVGLGDGLTNSGKYMNNDVDGRLKKTIGLTWV